MPLAGTAAHEKVGPSRDPKGAVEAICRVCPSLTVGSRVSAIFMGDLWEKAKFAVLVSILFLTPKLLGSSEIVRLPVNPPVLKNALEQESLGLFPAGDFQVTTGRCNDCAAPKQALWYFQDDLIAVPKSGLPVAGFDRTLPYLQDVAQWASRFEDQDRLPFPPLVWITAPQILEHTHLSPDGSSVLAPNREPIHLTLTPRIPTNRSYYDRSTVTFFQNRSLRIRGSSHHEGNSITFVARTIWPEDYLIKSEQLVLLPLQPGESLSRLIMDENGGAQGAFIARLLWKRPAAESLHGAGKAVQGFLLSGAQGDDDESLGGHFAVVTGKLGPEGDVSHEEALGGQAIRENAAEYNAHMANYFALRQRSRCAARRFVRCRAQA